MALRESASGSCGDRTGSEVAGSEVDQGACVFVRRSRAASAGLQSVEMLCCSAGEGDGVAVQYRQRRYCNMGRVDSKHGLWLRLQGPFSGRRLGSQLDDVTLHWVQKSANVEMRQGKPKSGGAGGVFQEALAAVYSTVQCCILFTVQYCI